MAILVLRVDGNVVSGDSQTIDATGVDTGVINNGMAIDTGGIASFNAADIGGDSFTADSGHNVQQSLGPNVAISIGGTALAVAAGAKTFTQNTSGTPNGVNYSVFDVSGLDQTTPFKETTSNSFNAVTPPGLVYSVDVGGLVVITYGSNINIPDIAAMVAAGWTQAGTTFALGTVSDWATFYRIATVDEVATSTVALMSGDGTGRGFGNLWVYNPGSSTPIGVTIDSVNAGNPIKLTENFDIVGSNFEAVTATITLSDTDDINDASAVTIPTSVWGDLLVTANLPNTANILYGPKFLFVTTDSAVSNASGVAVDLEPPTGNAYLTIEEQNDLGILVDTVGLEFGTDQLEYNTVSTGGGTVYIGFSGVVYIYNYPADTAPSSDSITIRLGDNTDQTWSSDALSTISFSLGVSGDIAQSFNALSQSAISVVTANATIDSGDIAQSFSALTQQAVAAITPNSTVNAGDIVSSFNSLTQALFGTAISDLDATIIQSFNPLTQSLVGVVTTNSVVNAGNINQSFSSLSQLAVAAITQNNTQNSGDISGSFNSLSQSLAGSVVISAIVNSGDISQSFNSMTQASIGVITNNSTAIVGNVVQSFNPISQSAAGVITPNSTGNLGNITQGFNSLTQALVGNAISDLSGDISQSFNSLSQSFVGVVTQNSKATAGDITQSFNSLSQSVIAVVARNTAQNTGDVSSSFNSMSQSLSGIIITPVIGANTGFIIQSFNPLSQSAIGIVTPNTKETVSNIGQSFNSLSQVVSGVITANSAVLSGNINQGFSSLTQSLSGSSTVVVAGNIAQTFNSLSQQANGIVVPNIAVSNGNINQSFNSLSQVAISTIETFIEGDIVQSFNNMSQSMLGTKQLAVNGDITHSFNSLMQQIMASNTGIVYVVDPSMIEINFTKIINEVSFKNETQEINMNMDSVGVNNVI